MVLGPIESTFDLKKCSEWQERDPFDYLGVCDELLWGRILVAVPEVLEEDAAISDDDRIAKEKVLRMVEAEQRARRIQAVTDEANRRASAAGVRFRSGDDSLVSDTGVPIVPQYSQTERREQYTPPSPTAAPEGMDGDADRSLPPLRLQK